MHDFLLAKQIVDKLLEIAKEKNLANIKNVNLEIGNIVLAHDNFPEHSEDINLDNLKFGLENLAKNTVLEKAKFNIKKITGNSWKIVDIEVK